MEAHAFHPATDHGESLPRHSDIGKRSRRAPKALGRAVDFRWQRPITEVMTRIAWTPSRQKLPRPEPRTDLAENLARTYDALWRRARHTHRALIDTTWDQLAVACGYPVGQRAETQMRRYLELLAEAGLVAFGGHQDLSGRWRYLDVELVEPPPLNGELRRSSSAGQATICEGHRRHETRKQRAARRRQPWRRCGGRPETVERRTLSWRSVNVESLLEGGGPYGPSHPTPDVSAHTRVGDARQERDAPQPGAGPNPSAAESGQRSEPPSTPATPPALTAADEKRAARRERRAAARCARLAAETLAAIRDGEIIPRSELQRYDRAAGDAGAERELFGRFASFLDSIPEGEA
jgi:hypothetical protein